MWADDDNLGGQSSSESVEGSVSEEEGSSSSTLEVDGMGLDSLEGLVQCKDVVGDCGEGLRCRSNRFHILV
jgi:hypothetical protein